MFLSTLTNSFLYCIVIESSFFQLISSLCFIYYPAFLNAAFSQFAIRVLIVMYFALLILVYSISNKCELLIECRHIMTNISKIMQVTVSQDCYFLDKEAYHQNPFQQLAVSYSSH